MSKDTSVKKRRKAPLTTPTDLGDNAGRDITGALNALLNRPDLFVSTVTEKLMTYALGRGVEYYDAPAVRAITREAGKNDYRFSSLVLGIASSSPFQMRRAASSRLPASSVAQR